MKRIDRTFNSLRNYISQKGVILNKSEIPLYKYIYTNNACLTINEDINNISFVKRNEGCKEFNWFGYEIDEGFYNITFEIKTNLQISQIISKNIGLKIHYPHEILYNFFMEDLEINIWNSVSIPIHINQKQNVIFIFDDYFNSFNIEFRNINFAKIKSTSPKKNIALLLYEEISWNKNDYSINYQNIYNSIINPLQNIYNIFIFTSVHSTSTLNKVANLYNPIDYIICSNTNNIFLKSIDNINYFSKICNINFDFLLTFRLDSIFKKSISELKFYINKFNFLSYHIPYYDDKIANSYEFMSVPYKYIYEFYNTISSNISNKNICHLLYSYLKNNKDINSNDFNFIFEDNYDKSKRTPLIKYLSDKDINISPKKGFLLNEEYLYNIYYHNKYSKILKTSEEYYFYKNPTIKYEPFQWIGLYIENNVMTNITISFYIKLMKYIDTNINNIGIKTHEPEMYYKDWIDTCELNIYTKVEINLKINKKSQYIILNFDNYLDKVEFYIKEFKISF